MQNLPKNTLTQIAQLESQLFPDDAWTDDSIAELLTSDINDIIIWQKNGQLQGYCLYQAIYETAEILRIGVYLNVQNQGIGTQIFTELFSRLRQKNAENLLLEVRADNQNAIGFYQKYGFETIHVRKNYYQTKNSDSIDALIMQKNLLES